MPFFAANISDGYMFGKKPLQDRVASCRSMELEAIEINNPYSTSPSHLAALLHNDETGESLQLVSIDTYNGPIDAPISQYAENDINDFMNQVGATISEGSDTSSIAATTHASMAYLNSDHKIFPREQLDGYASIPGALFAYNNSLATTFTYASIINVPCVNILPGTITHHNQTHAGIFNEIMSKSRIVYVNNTPSPYHDERCPSSCICLNDGQALPVTRNTTSTDQTMTSPAPGGTANTNTAANRDCMNADFHNPSYSACAHKPGHQKLTHKDFVNANPCYQILTPSSIETQELCCAPPFSMVVELTLPLYLTQSLTLPTVLPKILCILPLPHVQSMTQITTPGSQQQQLSTTENNNNSSSSTPGGATTKATKLTLNGNQSNDTIPFQSCSVLTKHYSYLTKTQHLNNKSYFLMKRLLPSQFLLESSHNLVDVFHNSFYLHEVVELYQHYYTDLYRILNQDGSSNNIIATSTQPAPSSSTQAQAQNNTPFNLNSPAITSQISDHDGRDRESVFQKLCNLQQQFNRNRPLSSTTTQQPASKLSRVTPQSSTSNLADLTAGISTPAPIRENGGAAATKESGRQPEPKAAPSPFVSLTFPTHGAYTPTSSLPNQSRSTSITSLQSPQVNQTTSDQQLPQATTSSRDSGLDLSSSRFDFLLTSLIFTTLVFNVKFAARNATRSDRLRDQLSLTLSITPQSYINNVFRLLRVMVFCSSDNIGIMYDVSSFYQQHGNIIALFERLSPLIRHVRVTNTHPELDNTIFFNTIHQINYTGWVSLDFLMSNTSIPTKKLLQPWFAHYLRRRNGSAGVLFMCRGKQGKVYILLGKETKHGQKTVGPFWGRPDKTDADIEMTAVRETIEESLGCVVNNATVLYSALKNKGFYYKCPRINLYLVNIGVLGVKERNDIVIRYTTLRRMVESSTSSDTFANLQNQTQFSLAPDVTSPNPSAPVPQPKDKHLTKSFMEMNDVIWVDLYDLYKHYMLKSARILSEYSIVIENAVGSPLSSPPWSPGPGSPTPRSPGDDDEKKEKKKKKDGKDKEKKKKKKDRDDDDDDDDDDHGDNSNNNNNNSGGGTERETIALQAPHNNEHTITSLVNTIMQQRGNYNNLPLRRFFLREMIYLWLTDTNWLNLVHRRDFPIHSIERLMQLHKQYVAEKEKQPDDQQTPPSATATRQTNSRVVSPPRQTDADDDLSSKQWRSAPL